MGFTLSLRGIGSGVEYPPDSIMNLCLADGRPVEIILDVERIRSELPPMAWYSPDRKDMWRFGALLPLDAQDALDRQYIVSLGEGCTPLLDYSDHTLAQKVGFSLEIKEEGRSLPGYGQNPTHSFKDRGMAMAVSMANKLGLRKLAVPTQGNAGDALVEYGLAAGMDIAVAMPKSTPMPILGKVAAFAQFHDSISLDVVEGTIREAGQLIKEKYVPEGYFSVATFQEPGWRIEGKKTMGYELAEPQHEGAPWSVPDVIIYPTGGGTGILGIWKAFNELEALGIIDERRPRIISVQSTETAPIVDAFRDKAGNTSAVEPGTTLAVGLNVPGGVGHFRVLEILYASGGAAIAVNETQIASTLSDIYANKGWWISPEGAACVAAIEPCIETGMIRPGDRVVAFNTGSMEKYLPSLRHLIS